MSALLHCTNSSAAFFCFSFQNRLKSAPQATQWLGSAWYRSESKLRALSRSWSADFRLAWWPGQPRSADDVTEAREGRHGWVYGGRGTLYFLVNRLSGSFPCSEYKCFVTIGIKNKPATVCEKFCRILHRLNFAVHWRSLTYHVTKVATIWSKAWLWVGCSLKVRRWTLIKNALWNQCKYCVCYRKLK